MWKYKIWKFKVGRSEVEAASGSGQPAASLEA